MFISYHKLSLEVYNLYKTIFHICQTSRAGSLFLVYMIYKFFLVAVIKNIFTYAKSNKKYR